MQIAIKWSVCRVCLQDQKNEHEMIPIFNMDDSPSEISHKIRECSGIQIDKEEDLPKSICDKCNTHLNIAYKFRTNCKKSDKQLRKFVETTFKARERLIGCSRTKEEVEDDDCSDDNYAQTENNEDSQEAKDEPCDDVNSDEQLFEFEEQYDTNDSQCKIDILDETEENETSLDAKTENHAASIPSAEEDEFVPKQTKRKTLSKSKDSMKTAKKAKTVDAESDRTACNSKASSPGHICDICGNIYSKRHLLDSHMKRHLNVKPHECEICHKTFGLNFQLVRHMRSHTGQKPYQCKYCERRFSDLSTNVKHERTHTNERPYVCDECGKSFTYSNVLKVHLSTHTGEKPYSCSPCGKKFNQLHHLKSHLQTITHKQRMIASGTTSAEDGNEVMYDSQEADTEYASGSEIVMILSQNDEEVFVEDGEQS